jgi:hypothetical protein
MKFVSPSGNKKERIKISLSIDYYNSDKLTSFLSTNIFYCEWMIYDVELLFLEYNS